MSDLRVVVWYWLRADGTWHARGNVQGRGATLSAEYTVTGLRNVEEAAAAVAQLRDVLEVERARLEASGVMKRLSVGTAGKLAGWEVGK